MAKNTTPYLKSSSADLWMLAHSSLCSSLWYGHARSSLHTFAPVLASERSDMPSRWFTRRLR